jgi:hypothetical protein
MVHQVTMERFSQFSEPPRCSFYNVLINRYNVFNRVRTWEHGTNNIIYEKSKSKKHLLGWCVVSFSRPVLGAAVGAGTDRAQLPAADHTKVCRRFSHVHTKGNGTHAQGNEPHTQKIANPE